MERLDLPGRGIALGYQADGPVDAPPVLFLHGLSGCLTTWDFAVGAFADRVRMHRVDLRGHGHSDRCDGYALGDYVADVAAVVEAITEEPVTVVGHSLGGSIAAALAQQRTDLVRNVVLEDPPLMAGTTPDPAFVRAFTWLRDAIVGWQASGVAVDDLVTAVAATPGLTGVPLGLSLAEDGLRSSVEGWLATDPEAITAAIEGRSLSGQRPELAIPVPTLVIGADPERADAAFARGHAERLCAASPLATVVAIAEAGHQIHDERAHRSDWIHLVGSALPIR